MLFGPPNIKRLKDKNNIKGLIVALLYKDSSVRKDAVKALQQIGNTQAVDALIATLDHWDKDTRLYAAQALGEIGDPRAVDQLIAALLPADLGGAILYAAEALGKIGDPRAVAPLIAFLKYDDPYVREAVAKALGKIGDSRAIGPLIDTASDVDVGWWARSAACKALVEIGALAVEPLIAALKPLEDEEIRLNVSWALGRIGDHQTVELYDKNKRLCAARTLGEIGDDRAVEPLIAALKDKDNEVQQAAIEALEKLQDLRGIEAVKEFEGKRKDTRVK